jgi:hypothetical protein
MKTAVAAVLTAVLVAQSTPRTDVRLPAETAGWDNVLAGLLSVFDRADVLALGEAHGRSVDAELRLRLIRHPQFAAKVHSIVVEMSATSAQRFGNPPYGGLFDAVREINQQSPTTPLQVIANDSPIGPQDRDAPAVAAIRDRVSKGDKVLVVYGSGHVWHRGGGVTSALDRLLPGRIFVAEVLAPAGTQRPGPESQALEQSLKALEDTVGSPSRPVLISLRGTRAAALVANPFYLGQAMLPQSTTIGDLDDACVYFGRTPDVGAPVAR